MTDHVTLIVGSIGGVSSLEALFASLERQTSSAFDVVVVDQSDQSAIEEFCTGGWPFDVTHTRHPRGLSRSRNHGLTLARGPIVAFPDDDALYPDDLVATVLEWFDGHPDHDGVLTPPHEPGQHGGMGRFSPRPGPVTATNVWTRAISSGLFLRASAVAAVGGFDETLGLGSGTAWGSGEDTDLPLRMLAAGSRLHYDPRFHADHHPEPDRMSDEPGVGRSYGAGTGRVLRLHRAPMWLAAWIIGRGALALVRPALRLDRRALAFRWAVLRGRLEGYRAAPPN